MMKFDEIIHECKDQLRSLINGDRNFKEAYCVWYYDTNIWTMTTFMGINCYKSVSDMWNYQEIIYNLKPSLIVEFGTAKGGSALYFSTILKMVNPESRVVSVDVNSEGIEERVKRDSHIELITSTSTDKKVENRLKELRDIYKGPAFAILDSDHTREHVLGEMELLRNVLAKGDYLVVEDGIVNGRPVLKGWGEGPLEALDEYFSKYPEDYTHDTGRENKFGFTFAPKGFLIRN
jgi:cephalosporin hydroxylase